MDLDMNIILGAVGSLATIETRIREAINQYNKYVNKKKIEKIDLEIKFAELKVMDDYSADHIDEYITKHASSFKGLNLSQVFSDSEKTKFITNFFDANKDLIYYQDSISKVLSDYISQIEKYISNVLTDGEKIIFKKVNQISDQVESTIDVVSENSKLVKSINSGIESIKEKICNSNIYRDSNYSENIIGLLNMIFVEIEINTGDKLLKRDLQPHSLKAENFEDVVLKIQKIISTIDKDRIEKIMKINFENGLYALHFYIQYIAADIANKVNLLFSEKTQLIIDCIYFFEDKDPKYYLALGAMGLRNNHTDENIYLCIMDNLTNYLSRLLEVLKEKWKNRDCKVLEGIAVEEMQKRLWYQIKFSITEKNRQWIVEIVKNDNITDAQLAMKFNVSLKELRKELYSATKTFLNHKYVDDYTTSIMVYRAYKEVIIKNLNIGV